MSILYWFGADYGLYVLRLVRLASCQRFKNARLLGDHSRRNEHQPTCPVGFPQGHLGNGWPSSTSTSRTERRICMAVCRAIFWSEQTSRIVAPFLNMSQHRSNRAMSRSDRLLLIVVVVPRSFVFSVSRWPRRPGTEPSAFRLRLRSARGFSPFHRFHHRRLEVVNALVCTVVERSRGARSELPERTIPLPSYCCKSGRLAWRQEKGSLVGTELSLARILPHCFCGFPSKGKLANPSTRCGPSLAKQLTLLARPVQI